MQCDKFIKDNWRQAEDLLISIVLSSKHRHKKRQQTKNQKREKKANKQ